jgi:surface protein
MGDWDMNLITTLGYLFKDKTEFNADISKWETGAVTDMKFTFYGCSAFNSDISKWDVSRITLLKYTFYRCTVFNGDLSKWDTRNLVGKSLHGTFKEASAFNSDISKWSVAKIDYMDKGETFMNAASFNIDVSNWDVSIMRVYPNMFVGAKAFNFKQEVVEKWSAIQRDTEFDTYILFKGVSMFQGTCSEYPNCGACGKRSADPSVGAVSCSPSLLPAKDPATPCKFCKDNGGECCNTPTCNSIDYNNKKFPSSSCPTSATLRYDLSVACAEPVCSHTDCCFHPLPDSGVPGSAKQKLTQNTRASMLRKVVDDWISGGAAKDQVVAQYGNIEGKF